MGTGEIEIAMVKNYLIVFLIALVAGGVGVLYLNPAAVPSSEERVAGISHTSGLLVGPDSFGLTDRNDGLVDPIYFDVTSGVFADATTTLATITNPFAATSTVDLAMLRVTGVSTTTINISVATSTTGYAPTTAYATTTSVVNMAPVMANSSAYIISGTTVGSSSGFNPAAATTTGTIASQQRIQVGPSDKLVIWVEDYGGKGSTAGVTNAVNTFAGNYLIRWYR